MGMGNRAASAALYLAGLTVSPTDERGVRVPTRHGVFRSKWDASLAVTLGYLEGSKTTITASATTTATTTTITITTTSTSDTHHERMTYATKKNMDEVVFMYVPDVMVEVSPVGVAQPLHVLADGHGVPEIVVHAAAIEGGEGSEDGVVYHHACGRAHSETSGVK